MFRQAWTVALVVLAALGSLTMAIAQESKEAGGKTKDLPKKLTVDLGNGVKLEMVLISGGEFLMGSPDSDKDAIHLLGERQHRVRITKPFYLGKYLVTQEQWEALMGNNPSQFKGPRNPVENVSWDDCQAFLGKLNAKTAGKAGKFVLPTEAQWEYACRAGSTTRYCFGDDETRLGEYAWYGANWGAPQATHPVGEKKPNAWGLYDMHGNAWEWCADWYDSAYYIVSPTDDPTGPQTGSKPNLMFAQAATHVLRGGSCISPAKNCQSAFRSSAGTILFSAESGSRNNLRSLRVCCYGVSVKGQLP